MKKRVKALYKRLPQILRYVLRMFFLWFSIGAAAGLLLYAGLSAFGLFSGLESALDLKASSPWIRIPMYAFLVGAVLCFFIGSLMYFHKYKRSVSRGKFHAAYSAVLSQEQKLSEKKN